MAKVRATIAPNPFPSTAVSGLFDEAMDGSKYIPQGYGCDEFLRDGQLITAAQPDANIAALLFPLTGTRLMDTLDLMPRMASLAMLAREPGLEGVFGDEPHGFVDPGRIIR